MRGIHSVVDDLRNSVFREVAKLAYEGGDYSRIDRLPYKIQKQHFSGESYCHREATSGLRPAPA